MVAARPRSPRGSTVAAAAFLRIYEPLEALSDMPAAERKQWRALAACGEADPATTAASGLALAAREHAAALRAASALPPRLVVDLDLGLVEAGSGRRPDDARPGGALLSPPAPDGTPRVCPADLALRAMLALEELRLRLEPVLLAALVPPAVVDDAADRLARSREARHAQHRASRAPHVRTSGWHIPLAWFAMFSPDQRLPADNRGPASPAGSAERDVDTDATTTDADRPGPSLRSAALSVRYLAPMADARRLVARALAAVRRSPTELLPAAELERLGRWLEEFHPRSVVELDYGGLVGLIPDAELAEYESVASVSQALADLRAGAGPQADEALRRLAAVRDRWAAVRAFERAS